MIGFSNDLESFQDKEEVKRLNWGTVSKLLNQSKQLLNATLQMDETKVAQLLEDVHDDMQEFKEYNNEHTLKCVIHLAY